VLLVRLDDLACSDARIDVTIRSLASLVRAAGHARVFLIHNSNCEVEPFTGEIISGLSMHSLHTAELRVGRVVRYRAVPVHADIDPV
jgi:hypothetical protein